MNISKLLFGEYKKCKTFQGEHELIRFQFENGTASEISLPAEIIFIGMGCWDIEYQKKGILIDTSWDFCKEEYCPILFSNLKWGLINNCFEVVTPFLYDSLGEIYVGCGCHCPPYANDFWWDEDGACLVELNGESVKLYKQDLIDNDGISRKSYRQRIESMVDFTLDAFIEDCKKHISNRYRLQPYRHPELRNGINLLHSEEGMDAYIAAYGEMHVSKCRAALQNFPYDEIQASVEIVDWGCGQGIGALCVINALDEHNKSIWLKKVTLIEPSPYTQNRAILNITKVTNGNITIIPLNMYLPGDGSQEEVDGITYTAKNVIHVFSNILDVESVDLRKLAILSTLSGHNHYILCIGPLNSRSYRIDQFCSIFGQQKYFSNIVDSTYGRTSDTGYIYTCKTKCFRYNGNPLNYLNIDVIPTQIDNLPVYDDYNPQLAVQNGVISASTCRLFSIFSKVLNEEDIILLKPDINGDKPDIVIIRPNKGILLVKVFDDDISNFHFPQEQKMTDKQPKIRTSLLQKGDCMPVISPLTMVDSYQDNLIRLHLEGMIHRVVEDKDNWTIIKKMVFFSKNTFGEATHFFRDVKRNVYFFGTELLNTEKNQKDILYKLHFCVDNAKFDNRVLRSFMRIITPKWHSYKEGKHINLTTPQRNLAISVADKKQKISGVAGAGKTQVLAHRVVNAQKRTGGNILVLTYNKTLANYVRFRINEVRADFNWDKITVDYYHHFIRTQANNYGLHIISYEDEASFAVIEKLIERYAAIFVDEAQDYMPQWLRILNRYFLVEQGEFIVFGDPQQNIYNRSKDKNGDINLGAVIGGSWNHELKQGKRFANPQLAMLAMNFQKEYFMENTLDSFDNNQFAQGVLMSIKYANIGRTTDVKKLAKYCRDIIAQYHLRHEEVVVLSQASDILRDIDYQYRYITGLATTTTFINYEEFKMLLKTHKIQDDKKALANYMFKRDKDAIEHNKKLHFTMDTPFVKISTIHSYKGWESSSVILFIEPESANREDYCISARENIPELIYTAITRAKDNLFIINLGNDKYDVFFNNYIK